MVHTCMPPVRGYAGERCRCCVLQVLCTHGQMWQLVPCHFMAASALRQVQAGAVGPYVRRMSLRQVQAGYPPPTCTVARTQGRETPVHATMDNLHGAALALCGGRGPYGAPSARLNLSEGSTTNKGIQAGRLSLVARTQLWPLCVRACMQGKTGVACCMRGCSPPVHLRRQTRPCACCWTLAITTTMQA